MSKKAPPATAPPPSPAPVPPPAPAPAALAQLAAERRAVLESQLAARGPYDPELLDAYCHVWARWRQAEDGIAKTGQMVKGPRGRPIVSPLLAIASKALSQSQRLGARLGIDDLVADAPAAPVAASGPIVDRVRLSEILGVHPDTITHYARKGMPVVARGGRGRESQYDAFVCMAWWRKQGGGNAKEAAQIRRDESQAALNEQRLQERRKELVARDQVILAGQSYTKAWAAKVRALPRRFVEAGIITREQEAAAAGVCREVLTEIASWTTVAGAVRVAKKAARKAKARA